MESSRSTHHSYIAGLQVERENSLRRRFTQRIIEEITLPIRDKLLVGASAGIIGTSLIFPMDTLKTRLQSSSTGNVVQCFKNIITKEGPRGFYKGLLTTSFGVVPEKALQLGVNEICRDVFKEKDGSIKFHLQMLAAAIGATFQVAMITPTELVKIRMQNQALLPPSQRQGPLSIIRSLGFEGLYKGVDACVMRDLPFAIICFPMFSTLKNIGKDQNGQISNSWLIAAGAFSGAVSSGAVTPFDVVKTRMQMGQGAEKYESAFQTFSLILRKEGFSALFRGIGQRMPMTGVKIGLILFAFEKQKEYLIASRKQELYGT